ncbi:TrmH family RNA methyltransferase [Azospirillum rugosum]|uniref:tRNA G18 (Ribose-2'-O)-methylase SpoU n=1 Tax=Azospirillum rugosum TaxID=416170 RepID=A0ABS4SGP2_9PROT|nr:RNA methyltransferase [Azospirillum rugosum]MBP2291736.1 tRNA G18 (ribose-2'-O)-methylase SpoU [Azospirillum rugosum]MDQ0524452.1 tRNA G18 (ribose-2'-O)-methylase SpoU [Azospirillum rugosum]
MPAIIPIDDPLDPRIAPYRDVRERDLVGREGLFIAEGAVVLRSLLTASRHEALSLLIAEKRVAALMPMLEALPEGVPVYTAGQAVLDAVAGFPLHRGILALGRRAAEPEPDALLSGLGRRAVVLALCGIGNHDNVGGIFRNAAAFGVDAVLLDSGCCDPLYRKAIRVSVGATLMVPFVRLAAGTDLVGLLERHGFATISLSPAGSVALAGLRRPERAALLLGSEGPGLPASVLARTRTVRIPMAGSFDSLNVATTSGIVLHHLSFVAPPESVSE